jgi:hypothetical protein
MIRWILLAVALIILFLLMLYPLAHAQHNHSQHHAFYQFWINKADKGCCNNQDCGILREEDERSASKGIEVRIEGKWCPVLSHHYLKKGNAPDWSSAHVCVQKMWPNSPPKDPCDRLLCYQPRPGI